jgi:RNA polymerase sigma factor (sigma-70 family)
VLSVSKRLRGILDNLLGRHREAALSEVVGDRELLDRFIASRDEAAFELLVWRHGAMVLGICRRAIHDHQLAEDAFQAVFIVLARKAGSIRGGNIAGWLFRVARRVAARAVRRRPLMELPADLTSKSAAPRVEQQELTEVLDAEVARLPDRLRRAVILCYLGGQTAEDAARELGCPRGTVLSRLATARKRLARRLTRRGLALPAAWLAFSIATTERLVSQTIATIQIPFNRLAPSGPAQLAESVVRTMTTTKLMMAACAALLATGLTFGVGWMATGTAATDPAVAAAKPPTQEDATPIQARPNAQSKAPKPPDRAERLKMLREQSERIQLEVRMLEDRLSKLSRVEVDLIDPVALQAELLATDRQILLLEKQQRSWERSLEAVKKQAEDASKKPLDERLLAKIISSYVTVSKALAAFQTAELNLANLKSKAKPESAVVIAAMKEVTEADTVLKTVREETRPKAERALREEMARGWAESVGTSKRELESRQSQLKDLWESRKQLAARIVERKHVSEKQQAIKDELSVLRIAARCSSHADHRRTGFGAFSSDRKATEYGNQGGTSVQ